MIDNGYLFAKDNKRIFINTSLGCAGQCAYCYLPKMGYSNGSDNYRTISAQTIIEFIEKNKLDINQKTLITLGCYSECWDEYNKNETISLIKYFLKKGNQIQLSTKKQIMKEELTEILPLINYFGQLVIFVSSATISKHDTIEKNMILLGISRNLFTHSLPLVVAEQCYMKLLKDARCLVQDTKIAAKREKAYTMVLNLIEDYNIRLLSTKVYWDNSKEREEFKKFYEQYKQIEKLKEVDFIKYVKEKEILFIKTDLKKIRNDKTDYSRLIKYYKRKLVDYGVMKEIRKAKKQNVKYFGKRIKEQKIA